MKLSARRRVVKWVGRLSLFFLLGIALHTRHQGLEGAQFEVEVRRNDVAYQFGQLLRFTLDVAVETDIHSATLLFSTPGMPSTLAVTLPQTPAREIRLAHEVDLSTLRMEPFSELSWKWVLTNEDGATIELPEQSTLYRDDRFLWSSLTRRNWTVYWSEGDVSLGQMVLDIVEESLPKLQAVFPVREPSTLRIYLYPTSSDLQEALRLTGYEWVAGHTAPQLDAILIALPALTTAEPELRRIVPHELSHLLMVQATAPSNDSVSVWFDEGMATYFELDGNVAYQLALQQALDANETIPFTELCFSYPDTEREALLAYAQSGSIIGFLQSRYGNHALTELILAYGDGMGCEAAVQRVLGMTLAELEAVWKDANASRPAVARLLRNYGWWLVLAAAGFLSVILMVWTPQPGRHRNSPW